MNPDRMRKFLMKQRKLFGVSIRELGVLTGYGYHTVRRWEKGRRLSAFELHDWADAFGYDLVLKKRNNAD